MKPNRVVLIATLIFCLFLAVIAQSQPRYTLTDLGAFMPRAINGPWIVGSEGGLPVRLNLATGQKEMLGHHGHGGVAEDVNAAGWTVGALKRVDSGGVLQDVATVWRPDGTFTGLSGTLPSYAVAINDSIVMTGTTNCVGGLRTARWWADGRTEECTSPPVPSAGGIDGQHRVWGMTAQGLARWDPDGSVAQFGLPLGRSHGDLEAVSPDGGLATGTVGTRAWAFNGSFVQLQSFPELGPGYTDCGPSGANRHHQVVGYCADGIAYQAALWPDEDSPAVSLKGVLGLPEWSWSVAYDISDEGAIVGQASRVRNFLLTPLPEVEVVSAGPEGITVQVTSGGQPASNMPVWGGVVDGLTWQWHPTAVAHTDASGHAVLPSPLPPDLPGTHYVLMATWAGTAVTDDAQYTVPLNSVTPVLIQNGRSVVAHVLANGRYGVPNVPTWGGSWDAQWNFLGAITVAPTDSRGQRVVTPLPGAAYVGIGTWWGDAYTEVAPQMASR